MSGELFYVGSKIVVSADSPAGRWSAFFEDDGETGYFYALDPASSDQMILDAVHIYNVANIADRNRPSAISIVWSTDESKCALLINGYPHAVFDFGGKRGYCRTNFPNFPKKPDVDWQVSDHSWSDAAAAWLSDPTA